MKFTIYLIRHESRYDIPVYDCSLAPLGMFNAQTTIIEKIESIMKNKKIKNIYCSPFLRTIQTIYPFALKYNRKINIENGLYEKVSHDIKHYALFKTLPKMNVNEEMSFYYNEHKLFMSYLSNQTNDIGCKYFSCLSNTINDKITILTNNKLVEKNIKQIHNDINRMTYLVSFNMLHNEHELKNDDDKMKMIDECNKYNKKLCDKFEKCNMVNNIDLNYHSIIDIDDHMKNTTEEDNEILSSRINKLITHVINNSSYHDSLYVTHKAIIESILENLCNTDYFNVALIDGEQMISLDQSMIKEMLNKININTGDIIELDILHDTLTLRFI
jgi:broad specificity phosphatase PhoE